MPLSSMTSSLARPDSRPKKFAPLGLCCESETMHMGWLACKGRLHRDTICWPDMNCFPVMSTQLLGRHVGKRQDPGEERRVVGFPKIYLIMRVQ